MGLSYGEVDRIQSIVEGVDQVAVGMENKWGIGRLRLIVSTDLRIRFDQQRQDFNNAVWPDDGFDADVGKVDTQAAGMIRGWQALDAAATESGQVGVDPKMIEVPLSDGSVAIITDTNADASAIIKSDRSLRVYTTDEIARLIEATDLVLSAKAVFPGATVMPTKTPTINPEIELNDMLGI
jgi:hypothetical protein